MVRISEWLPNPTGNDAQGEWVELWNNGPDAVHLAGWKVAADSGKGYSLSDISIAGGDFVVLHRSGTRLILKNTDGSLTLTDPSGTVRDRAAFVGVAPEGMSANRTESGRAIFAKPTPDAMNAQPTQALIGSALPNGEQVRMSAQGVETTLIGIVCGIVFAAAALFVIKRNHGLSELFFSRN